MFHKIGIAPRRRKTSKLGIRLAVLASRIAIGLMSQIFHRSANTIARVSIFGAVFFIAGLLGLFAEVNRSPWVTEAHVAREQPIQFSHERHVAGNGIDCRYCHTSVEDSSFAGIPPTKTCMNCHSQIFANSPFLEPVRESFRTGTLDSVDARPRPARLRLLQPQHPREQGRRLHDLPRPGRSHAADVAGAVAADGMVPRLPPQPRALRAPARRGVPRRLRAAAESGSSSARGWSPSIRFRSSRAARRATDERHGLRLGLAASDRSGGRSKSSPTIRRFRSVCTTSSRRRSKRSPIRSRGGRS